MIEVLGLVGEEGFERKRGYFLEFFVAEDIARDLNPWLVPLRSAEAWIRRAASGVIDPFLLTLLTSILRV
jgi:hypothetical protein